MQLPRNGSLTANCLLIAAGAAVGSLITGVIQGGGQGDLTAASPRRNGEAGSPGPVKALTSSRTGEPASIDPSLAVASARVIADPAERAASLRRAGAAAALKGVEEGLRLGMAIESDQDRLEFHRGLYGEWAEVDPAGALAHAKTGFAPGLLQSEVIGIGINKWAAERPREAWLWAEQNLSGPLKEQALTDVMIGWTRRSPEIAADWIAGTGYTSQPLFNAVAGTWAEQDPAGAASWAESLPEGAPKQIAKVAVASEWSRQDPAAAAAHFAPDVQTDGGVNLATALTQIWGTTDPAATSEWVAQLSPGAGKNEAAATLATVWAATDIQGAVGWSNQLADAGMRQQVVTHIGTTWGAIEPDAALDWLTSLPPDVASEGIAGAYNSWAGTDPVGLRDYIGVSQGDPTIDQARLSLADVLVDSNAPAALDLAAGLSTASAQEDAMARYFRQWRKSDDQSAREWLGTNWDSLTPPQQERLATESNRRVIPR